MSIGLNVYVGMLGLWCGLAGQVYAGEGENAGQVIREALSETPLAGRIVDVDVHTQDGHGLASIEWRCGASYEVDKEASYAAWSVHALATSIEHVVVWCVDEHHETHFSAKISRGGFEKIQKNNIERFASSRFIKLFDDIHRL